MSQGSRFFSPSKERPTPNASSLPQHPPSPTNTHVGPLFSFALSRGEGKESSRSNPRSSNSVHSYASSSVGGGGGGGGGARGSGGLEGFQSPPRRGMSPGGPTRPGVTSNIRDAFSAMKRKKTKESIILSNGQMVRYLRQLCLSIIASRHCPIRTTLSLSLCEVVWGIHGEDLLEWLTEKLGFSLEHGVVLCMFLTMTGVITPLVEPSKSSGVTSSTSYKKLSNATLVGGGMSQGPSFFRTEHFYLFDNVTEICRVQAPTLSYFFVHHKTKSTTTTTTTTNGTPPPLHVTSNPQNNNNNNNNNLGRSSPAPPTKKSGTKLVFLSSHDMTLSKKPAPSPSSPSSPPLSKRTRMALGGTRRRDSDTSLCFKKEVELSYYDLEDMIHADPGYREAMDQLRNQIAIVSKSYFQNFTKECQMHPIQEQPIKIGQIPPSKNRTIFLQNNLEYIYHEEGEGGKREGGGGGRGGERRRGSLDEKRLSHYSDGSFLDVSEGILPPSQRSQTIKSLIEDDAFYSSSSPSSCTSSPSSPSSSSPSSKRSRAGSFSGETRQTGGGGESGGGGGGGEGDEKGRSTGKLKSWSKIKLYRRKKKEDMFSGSDLREEMGGGGGGGSLVVKTRNRGHSVGDGEGSQINGLYLDEEPPPATKHSLGPLLSFEARERERQKEKEKEKGKESPNQKNLPFHQPPPPPPSSSSSPPPPLSNFRGVCPLLGGTYIFPTKNNTILPSPSIPLPPPAPLPPSSSSSSIPPPTSSSTPPHTPLHTDFSENGEEEREGGERGEGFGNMSPIVRPRVGSIVPSLEKIGGVVDNEGGVFGYHIPKSDMKKWKRKIFPSKFTSDSDVYLSLSGPPPFPSPSPSPSSMKYSTSNNSLAPSPSLTPPSSPLSTPTLLESASLSLSSSPSPVPSLSLETRGLVPPLPLSSSLSPSSPSFVRTTHIPPSLLGRLDALSISTYPSDPHKPTSRLGDPICDRFHLRFFREWTMTAIADGCSWGSESRLAAVNACRGFLNFIQQCIEQYNTIEDISKSLLIGLGRAHEAILYGRKPLEVGTTTFLGGVIFPLDEKGGVGGGGDTGRESRRRSRAYSCSRTTFDSSRQEDLPDDGTVTLLTLLMHKNLSSIFLDFLTASNLSGFLHFFYFLEAIENFRHPKKPSSSSLFTEAKSIAEKYFPECQTSSLLSPETIQTTYEAIQKLKEETLSAPLTSSSSHASLSISSSSSSSSSAPSSPVKTPRSPALIPSLPPPTAPPSPPSSNNSSPATPPCSPISSPRRPSSSSSSSSSIPSSPSVPSPSSSISSSSSCLVEKKERAARGCSSLSSLKERGEGGGEGKGEGRVEGESFLPPLSLPAVVGGGERGAGGVGEGRRCFEGCWGEIGGKFEAEVFPKFYKSRHFLNYTQEYKQLYPFQANSFNITPNNNNTTSNNTTTYNNKTNKEDDEDFSSLLDSSPSSPLHSPRPSPLSPSPSLEGMVGLPLYGYCFVSVGDCKAFAFSQKKRMFMDITGGNRLTSRDPTDPGGRLGPSSSTKKKEESVLPDLRNLSLYYHEFEEGDLLLLMSDGVHDNLDPEILGYSPLAFGIPAETWDVLGELLVAVVKVFFSGSFLSKLCHVQTGPHERQWIKNVNRRLHFETLRVSSSILDQQNHYTNLSEEMLKQLTNNMACCLQLLVLKCRFRIAKFGEGLVGVLEEAMKVSINLIENDNKEKSRAKPKKSPHNLLSHAFQYLRILTQIAHALPPPLPLIPPHPLSPPPSTPSDALLLPSSTFAPPAPPLSSSSSFLLPEFVVSEVVGHCYWKSQRSREEVEGGGRRMETNYAEFPGKMDHTTLVCSVVGEVGGERGGENRNLK